MCRLLGIIANKPVDLEFSLERFKNFAKWNPDGWGIGWYENNKSKVFKEGISAIAKESKFPCLSKEVISHIIIAHVRKGTKAVPAKRNSHPFKYENWIFAHNGEVDKEHLLLLLRMKYKNSLEGETDSEVYFYWILQCVEECNGNIVEGIKKALKEVTAQDYTSLNFLLSNGKCLYAFRYSKSSKDYYSLYKLKRMPSEFGLLELISQETKAMLRSKSLKGEKAILVCSEKLTEEEWEEINVGNLLIINSDLNIEEIKIF
jgi:glutamine amidotransferase